MRTIFRALRLIRKWLPRAFRLVTSNPTTRTLICALKWFTQAFWLSGNHDTLCHLTVWKAHSTAHYHWSQKIIYVLWQAMWQSQHVARNLILNDKSKCVLLNCLRDFILALHAWSNIPWPMNYCAQFLCILMILKLVLKKDANTAADIHIVTKRYWFVLK